MDEREELENEKILNEKAKEEIKKVGVSDKSYQKSKSMPAVQFSMGGEK